MENNSLPWNVENTENQLEEILNKGNEQNLLQLIRNNSFLLYELYSRKTGTQPAFHEIPFGNFRLDFAWLNDNSDGPEWVLVELENPQINLFTQKGEPTQELNHAIEQVKSWDRYFKENPTEKKRIFGAVSRFRFVLIAGKRENWDIEKYAKWRIYNNNNTCIEIHSLDVFRRSIATIKEHPEQFWSFAEYPVTLAPSKLEYFWKKYTYMDFWRKIIS